MSERCCQNCTYWHCTTAFIEGECRQFSPDIGDTYEQRWPRTRPDEWCGQFSLIQITPLQHATIWQRIIKKVMR